MTTSTVTLASADLLTTAEANAVAGRGSTTVIGLVGPTSSGKTTLLAVLYQRFHARDGFADFQFVSSKSIRAFEQRVHASRLAAHGTEPATPRTELAELGRYLHLELVRNGDPGTRRHLLFADWSGELYSQVTNSVEATSLLAPLRRADHVAFVLDGRLMADLAERHLVARNALLVARRLVESGIVGRESFVQVLATKWDRVRGGPDPESAISFADTQMDAIEAAVRNDVGAVSQHQLVSFSREPGMHAGDGLARLLEEWMTRNSDEFRSAQIDSAPIVPVRHFDRATLRST